MESDKHKIKTLPLLLGRKKAIGLSFSLIIMAIIISVYKIVSKNLPIQIMVSELLSYLFAILIITGIKKGKDFFVWGNYIDAIILLPLFVLQVLRLFF